jgi:hypothetical protein
MIPTMEKGIDGEAETPPAVSRAQTDLRGAGGGGCGEGGRRQVKETFSSNQISIMPPPLVRRCNGTTAGLGYMKAIWIVLEKVRTIKL